MDFKINLNLKYFFNLNSLWIWIKLVKMNIMMYVLIWIKELLKQIYVLKIYLKLTNFTMNSDFNLIMVNLLRLN